MNGGHFDGRIEKRLPTSVPVYLASLDEARSRERTLTESVSPHGARNQPAVLAVWRRVAYYAFNGRISGSRKSDLLFANCGGSLLRGCRILGSHG